MIEDAEEIEADELALERVAFDVEREGFDLFRAACLLPRIEGRSVDVQACVEHVEALGARAKAASGASADEDTRRQRLLALLFDELGFAGDEDDTDAPRNSFVPEVLRRRMGLPITLSLIVCAVADAAGVAAFGVGLPRRFVVALGTRRSFVLVDPFRRGATLSPEDIRAITGAPHDEAIVEAVTSTTPRAILTRMLVNLHGSYLRRRDADALVAVLSRMAILEPRNAALFLQRGQVRLEQADFAGALADLAAARRLGSLDPDQTRAAAELERRLNDGQRYSN
jgi:regulator of sirC expression with transglutaminase-like and TPR domain